MKLNHRLSLYTTVRLKKEILLFLQTICQRTSVTTLADKAGQSIRTLEGCTAVQQSELKAEWHEILNRKKSISADTLWRRVSKTVNIEKGLKVVKRISGSVGNIVVLARNKGAEPRHVAIYLAPRHAQYTLVNIGNIWRKKTRNYLAQHWGN